MIENDITAVFYKNSSVLELKYKDKVVKTEIVGDNDWWTGINLSGEEFDINIVDRSSAGIYSCYALSENEWMTGEFIDKLNMEIL